MTERRVAELERFLDEVRGDLVASTHQTTLLFNRAEAAEAEVLELRTELEAARARIRRLTIELEVIRLDVDLGKKESDITTLYLLPDDQSLSGRGVK